MADTKTTLEMDSLFTKEDVDNRRIVMIQCAACYNYTKWNTENAKFHCSYCNHDRTVLNSGVSLRTFNPANHNKNKKPKTK